MGGKPIIVHAINGLIASGVISELVVVANSDWIERVTRMLSDASEGVALSIVPGGTTRTDSTQAGLAALSQDVGIVVIHDAARPFIDGATVRASVEPILAGLADATDVLIPTSDTIVSVDGTGGWVVDVPPRSLLRRGQTPQSFLRSALDEAYAAHRASQSATSTTVFTDDIGLLLAHQPSARVAAVAGSHTNIKITYAEDLMTADALIRGPVSPPSSPTGRLTGSDCTAVMGGTSGIGLALVELLVEAGVPVLAGSRRTGHDITTASGRLGFLRQAVRDIGEVRHLVISAGDLTLCPVLELTDVEIERQVMVNFVGPVLAAKEAVGVLGSSLESVTFIGSSSYSRGRANYALYSAAKAALVAATQALAEEWTESGIRVNILVPERTRTPMRTRHFGDEPGAMLEPEKVAEEIVYLLAGSQSGLVVQVKDKGGGA